MVTKIWPIRMFFVTFHSLAVSKLFSFWILNCVITSGRTYESVGAPSPRVRRGQRRHSGRARPLEGRREHGRGGGRRGRARTEQEEQQPVDPVHGGGEARDPPRDHAVLREPQRRPEPAEGLPRRVVHAVHQPERHGRRDGRRVRRGAQDDEDRERGELRAGEGGARVERAKGGAGAQRRGGARTISRLADGCANRPSSSQLELEYGVASGKAAPADMIVGGGREVGARGAASPVTLALRVARVAADHSSSR